jgi:hypothetical protein
MWLKLMALGASALFCAVLLVSGPASAAPTTGGATTGGTGYGPATSPSTVVSPTTAAPVATPKTSPVIAFTGAEIELMVVIGAAAIGVGGTLVLVSRRRRAAAHAQA